jgi:hypothetical protein
MKVLKLKKRYKALSLMEVMVAAATLFIIVVGALSYQYHTVVHNRKAQSNLTATRTAQLLLEDWKNNGGSPYYDPTTLELGFIAAAEKEADYYCFVDNLPMYIKLVGTDIDYDEDGGVVLRKLDVKVSWRGDYRSEAPGGSDPYIVMTTYVRNDAAGG